MTADARTVSAWRRAGYRVLPGDSFSYILHLRPAEWPIMAAHTALGFVLAVGVAPALRGDQLRVGLWALFVWVVLLNGGTLALNSVFDKDEGDIGYLRAPPPPPAHLLGFSLALLVAGQLLAFTLPAPFRVAYALCFAMSIAYSVPPLRFKAVAGVDWVINMWGFGTVTPYAGWAATGRPLDLAHGLVLLGFCPLFAALYPLTQIYQFDEDRRRGDRTLALILGMRASLAVAILAAVVAFLFFAVAAASSGAGGATNASAVIAASSGAAAALRRGARLWQWIALAIALAGWLVILVPWYRRRDAMTPAEHQRGFYAALTAWAVTDVAVLLGFAV